MGSARTVGPGVALTLLLVLAVAGCGDVGATEPTNRANATVAATVTADGSALADVTVQLFAEAGTTVLETATTDASGRAEFTGLIAGTYDVEITVPAGYSVSGGSVRQTLTVDRGGTTTATFSLVS